MFKIKSKSKDKSNKIKLVDVINLIIIITVIAGVGGAGTAARLSTNNTKNVKAAVESNNKIFEEVTAKQRVGSAEIRIIRDKETGMEYIIVENRYKHTAISITPRLNENDEVYVQREID